MTSHPVTNPTAILELIEELYDLPHKEVQQRLNKYIQNETNARLAFLALPESKDILIYVIGEEILDSVMRLHNTILYEAMTSENPSPIRIAILDQELLRYINRITKAKPQSLLAIPIRHPLKSNTALLVCLIDYTGEIDANKKIVEDCYRFCLGYLLSSLRCYEEARVRQQCLNLLNTSVNLCIHLYEEDLSVLLHKIMAEAKKLTNAETFSLFLLDPNKQELVAKVFDGSTEGKSEVRIPIGKGIAGYVTTTGEILNVRDAYSSELFYREIDKTTGFKTKNILCFPIRNEKEIIGAAQVCNKQNGSYFDVFDEQIASAFSFFCGISIMNSINYKNLQVAQNQFKLSHEFITYHMKVNDSDMQTLLNCPYDHSVNNLSDLQFNPRSLPFDHLPCYTIKMFTELGFFNYWKIKKSTLARFILYVKKSYRDPPYHNWTHAFCVTHFAYLLLKNVRLVEDNYMTPLEALVFFVSCLCHDIDHRGTTNSYQISTSTPVGAVYSSQGSSVMERHHIALTMCILKTENCNIFESLSREEYKTAVELLSSYILATDLFAQSREEQEKMIRQYNKQDPKQKKTLFGMLMNCCDLSDNTKDWRSSKNIAAKQVYSEFFNQGDLEKRKGRVPDEMMDRERAFIPDIQITFMSNIVLPLYTNLSSLFPSTQPLLNALERNLSLWKEAKSLIEKHSVSKEKSLDILFDPNFDDEVLKMYHESKCTVNQSCSC